MKKTSNEFKFNHKTDEPPITMETLPPVADVVSDVEVVSDADLELEALRVANLLRQLGVVSLENFTQAPKLDPELNPNYAMKSWLQDRMVGQQQAIDSLIDAFDRAIFREEDKPFLSVLFLGPTGVGKTELGRALDLFLHGIGKEHFTRIDCTDYQENHQAALLVGSPPGYVGREVTPLLDQSNITDDPDELHVLLFDEIEKGAPTLQKFALQILEEAELTMQSTGKKTSFRNCIIIFTSNLGAQEVAKAVEHVPSGFGGHSKTLASPTYEAIQKIVDKEVKSALLPEFLGRIDQRVLFGALDDEQLGEVMQKYNEKLSPRVLSQGISLTLTPDLVSALVQSDPERRQYGGRRITKTFKKTILGRLGQYVSGGSIPRGSDVYAVLKPSDGTVSKKPGEIDFEFLFAPNEELATAYRIANPDPTKDKMVKLITAVKHTEIVNDATGVYSGEDDEDGEDGELGVEDNGSDDFDVYGTPLTPDTDVDDYDRMNELRNMDLHILKLYRVNKYGLLVPKRRFDREKDILKLGLGFGLELFGTSLFKASVAANRLLTKPRS